MAKKRGNRLGIWFFTVAMRLTGLRGAYGLLYLVCAWYVWFDRAAVRSALPYVRRRFPGLGAEQQRRKVYQLFVSQGKNLIDRHALVAGAFDFRVEINGYEQIEALGPSQGFVLLTSHTGNWQAVMSALKKMNRRVHLLMRLEDNAALREAMQVDAEEGMVKVISPDQHLGGVVEMMAALEQGDIVSIMGDRTYGADSVEVDFLGDPAWFPYSAFQIAASARCPLAVMLSSKTGPLEYSVDLPELFWPKLERRAGDRKEQLRHYVQQYAAILEAYLVEHPMQYFIFFDLWKRVDKGAI
jgi:predicted LPLAT superfamily acyltransferase